MSLPISASTTLCQLLGARLCGFAVKRVLHDYGFDVVVWTYDHSGSIEHPHEQARISLPKYVATDRLRSVDLVIGKGVLEAWGLMNPAAFDGFAEKIS
jgi:hypothetical protein